MQVRKESSTTHEHTKKITYKNIYFISGLMNKHLKLKNSSVNTKIRLICTKKEIYYHFRIWTSFWLLKMYNWFLRGEAKIVED